MNGQLHNERSVRPVKRVLLAGTEIAGHYTHLKHGFDAIGVHADLASTINQFEYGGTRIGIFSLYARLAKRRAAAGVGGRILCSCALIVVAALCVVTVLFQRYDAVFFAFGTTFTRLIPELWLYRLFGIKVVLTFHGSDARPDYLDGALWPVGSNPEYETIARNAALKRRKIKSLEDNADVVIAYPAVSHFFEKPFINNTLIGNPIVIDEKYAEAPSDMSEDDRPVVILHGPSAPESKGSREIDEIVQKLIRKGYKIDFRLVHGVSNRAMLAEIARADILIDSLWNDTPAGTFPAEGGFLGKPVVIGSYLAPSLPTLFAKNEVPPYTFVHPDDMEGALELLVADRQYRLKAGSALRRYLRDGRAVATIAEKYISVIEGRFPQRWIFQPESLVYLQGYGAPEDHIRCLVKGLIDAKGIKALQLRHRPELERAFLEFTGRGAV